MATQSNTVSILPLKKITEKSILADIRKVTLNLASARDLILSTCDHIILFGDRGNDRGQHDYQLFNGLMKELVNHPNYEQLVIKYVTGKIPHGFRRVDGILKIGRLDTTLVMDKATLELKAKETAAARAATSEKTKAAAAERAKKLAEYPTLLAKIAELEKQTGKGSKAELNKLAKSNETLKAAAAAEKAAAEKAAAELQRVKSQSDKSKAAAAALLQENDKLKSDYQTLQEAYKTLKLETIKLQGQIDLLSRNKAA